jgi:hypothetical protein
VPHSARGLVARLLRELGPSSVPTIADRLGLEDRVVEIVLRGAWFVCVNKAGRVWDLSEVGRVNLKARDEE